MLPPRLQVARDLSTNNSLVTSPPFLIADLMNVTVSVSTSSNAAINLQLSNADGLQSPIPENSWFNVQAISIQSLYLINQFGARWSRISTTANSNSTILFAGIQPV